MRNREFWFLFVGSLLFLTNAQAHHPSAPATGGSRSLFYQSSQSVPQSRIFMSSDFQYLDNGIGQLVTTTVGGEWSVTEKWSLLGQLPVSYLSNNFTANQFGLGDLSLGSKYSLINTQNLLFASLYIELPTGDENKGLGQGSVATQASIFGGRRFKDWLIYASPGIHFAWAAPHEPQLNMALGVATPKIAKDRLDFGLALLGQIYLDSDTFTAGSSKWMLEPQLNWTLDKKKKFTLSQAVRISLVDRFSLKNGVAISQTSHSLFNDILWGFTTSIHYSFK